MRKAWIIAMIMAAAAVALSACTASPTVTPTPTATAKPTATSAAAPGQPTNSPTPTGSSAQPTASPTQPGTAKQWSSPPPMTIDKNKSYTATIKTNYGDIVVQLLPQDAPIAVNNFVFLARQNFYDGVKFHRVVKGFVIQGGDPTGTGGGNPGYSFADEKVTRDYLPGTVAMANSGANTNGSQFFICLADLRANLAKNYTIFGQVTTGMDVVQKIGNVPVAVRNGEASSPTVDVHIDTVIIQES